MTEPRTWSRQAGLATWSFETTAPVRPGPDRAAAVRRAAVTAVALLDSFGRAAHLELTTAADGDLPMTTYHSGPADRETAERTAATTDLVQAAVIVDAIVTYPGESVPSMVASAATILISPEDGPASERTSSVNLSVILHVDLYATRTWGPIRDNTAMAAMNGPRLSGYLERLARVPGWVLVEADAPDYPGQITPTGFG